MCVALYLKVTVKLKILDGKSLKRLGILALIVLSLLIFGWSLMVWMPGESYSQPLPPLSANEIELQIQLKLETQFRRRLGEGTGGDAIIEDVAAEAHLRAIVGLELQPVQVSEDIAAGKKADFVCRKIDRGGVAVGSFVADPELHGARVGQAVTFSHRMGENFSCMLELGRVFPFQI